MKPARNGVEGDAAKHFSTNDGLDKPLFPVDTDDGPSDHAPDRARGAARPNRDARRQARPR